MFRYFADRIFDFVPVNEDIVFDYIPPFAAVRDEDFCDVFAIEPQDMAYDPFPAPAALLQRQRFATLNDFSRFVYEAHYAPYFVHATRERIRTEYGAMLGGAPFSRVLRFPEDYYVAISNASIRAWMNQMMHAIELPDRMIEHGKGNGTNLNDAKRSYDVAVDNLVRIIESLDDVKLSENGIYNRESFERVFGCVWV